MTRRWWRVRAAGPDNPDSEFGLLVPAATVLNEHTARSVRQLLHAHGVRATTGRHRTRQHAPLRFRVLVFPEDAVRAYDVLCRHTS